MPGPSGPLTWAGLLIAALGAVGALGLFVVLHGRADMSPESRLYLRLVAACRRAGLAPEGAVTPLRLVTALQERGHPAAGPAGRLVDRYLRARFAGERAGEDALGRMVEDLRSARRGLRRA
jgi:hypothetical protein